MHFRHHCPAKPNAECSSALAMLWVALVLLATCLPATAAGGLSDARIVFVHAAPLGAAAAGATFRIDGAGSATLSPHAQSEAVSVPPGRASIAVDIPGAASLDVEHVFVADQTYVALLAGDGIRQAYTLIVDLPPSVVPRRGLAMLTIRDTATLPGLLPAATGPARYDRFLSCDGVLQRGPASFAQAADLLYIQPDGSPARCRAGLMERERAESLSEITFDGRSGRRLLVYATGNGIEAPLRHHLVDLGETAPVEPRPMGRDMAGMWASRSITGELLIVQQAQDGVLPSGIYTGFDGSGRPVWSAVRSRPSTQANEYALEVVVPVDGDPRGQRPFAGIAATAGTLLFLSCTEAVLEFVGRPLPPQQFLTTRGSRVIDGVRLSRLTAPNGCVDP